MDKRYEMLWNCEYCGAKKLLGKTHRFCPSCGAPQNPDKRFFPDEEDKVAVEDHEYFGADKRCPNCETATSAKSKFCASCGGPLDEAAEVARKGGPAPAKKPSPPPAAPKPWLKPLLIGLPVAGAAVLAVCLFWTKTASVTVSGHEWKREIRIEKYGPERDDDWCGSMPSDAYDVSRSREVRSHKKIPDGKDCRTVKEDLGDGTFREREECTTRYREEPVYDDKCSYTVDRWRASRSAVSSGTGLSPAPAWPAPKLREGTCVGCEREGAREETYTVRFAAGGKAHACGFSDEARWSGFKPGSKWSAKIRVATGGLVCGKLEPAK